MPDIQVLHGNCLDILPTLPDCSVDSIVTDPPYELGFMGKKWDNSGIAYNVTLWQECLRVLKPGGHLLAFGGTRTYHRMACAIEDAGFEIRDSIHWLYGSGFPKSLDVSKAIDKQAGAEREIIGKHPNPAGSKGNTFSLNQECDITVPATEQAKQWAGWGTALKPAHEPIVVARKPLVGTVAQNVLEWGTGAINIDGTRIGHASEADLAESLAKNPGRDDTVTSDVYGANRPQQSVNPAGRWPANVILTHHEDCQQVGVRDDTYQINRLEEWSGFGQKKQPDYDGSGRSVSVPVWECVPGCPVALLDEQSGLSKSTQNQSGDGRIRNSVFGGGEKSGGFRTPNNSHGDSGGASRFFYCAKPSRRERNAGLDHLEERPAPKMDGGPFVSETGNDSTKVMSRNHHPTVKPLALMRYLVRLVTPPNGTVLEPFAGSGTTLMAAILEGFNAIGIEMTDEYLPIIEGRLKWARQQPAEPEQLTLEDN